MNPAIQLADMSVDKKPRFRPVIHNRQGTFLGIIISTVAGGAVDFCIAPEGNGVCFD